MRSWNRISGLYLWPKYDPLGTDFTAQKVILSLSGVDIWCVEISCLHWTWLSPYSGFQVIFKDIGFHFKSGFKIRVYTQIVVFTLNLVSRKMPTLKIPLPTSYFPNHISNAKLHLLKIFKFGKGLRFLRCCWFTILKYVKTSKTVKNAYFDLKTINKSKNQEA